MAGLLQTDTGLDGCSLQRGGGRRRAAAGNGRGSVWGHEGVGVQRMEVQEESPLGRDIPPTLQISRLLSVSVLRLLLLRPHHKTSDQLYL